MLKKTLKKAIDFLSRAFFLFGKATATAYYSLKKKAIGRIEPKKILVLHFDGSKIGDAVLSTVVFPALKKNFPKAEIFALYNSLTKDVVENNPAIKKVFVAKRFNFFSFLEIPMAFGLRKYGFDVCLSISHNFSSHAIAFLCGAKYRIGWDRNGSGFLLNMPLPYLERKQRRIPEKQTYLGLLEPLGIKGSSAEPELFTSAKAMEKIEKMLFQAGFRKGMQLAGMHAGSAPDALARRWPKERFATLAEKIIRKKNCFVVLVGGKNEKEINEEIISLAGGQERERILDAAGNLSVSELIALAKKARVFVCNDSAPMHIAAASGCHTIAFFGPTDEILSMPAGNAKIMTKKIACRPCYLERKNSLQETDCKNNDCIKKISVQEVLEVVENALG